MLLHWRDPAKVATAAGIYDVIPAGEFQPSSVAIWDRRNDFDLWRTIVREYAEELLGEPEHDGTRSRPITYHDWPVYQRLNQAQADGSVTSHVLGLGLDALTLAATILTVVVIDDDVFTGAFGETVQFNEEGEIVAVGDGTPAEGVPSGWHLLAPPIRRPMCCRPRLACFPARVATVPPPFADLRSGAGVWAEPAVLVVGSVAQVALESSLV